MVEGTWTSYAEKGIKVGFIKSKRHDSTAHIGIHGYLVGLQQSVVLHPMFPDTSPPTSYQTFEKH